MDLGLRDKQFLIGGGTKGLGRAIAETLVAERARVLLMARTVEGAQDALRAMGPSATAVAADMADPSAPDTIAAQVDRHFAGRLDGILVNAGGPPVGEVFDLRDEQWRQSYELLIGGPIRLLRTLLPTLNDGSAILFITSSSVRQPVANLDTSNVLRPGVAALVKVLARELAPKARVNSLMPGRFDTDRVRSLDEIRAKSRGIPVEQARAEMIETIPLGRYGDPVEFGHVGAFLLSPAASYVSGVALLADGAMVTAVP